MPNSLEFIRLVEYLKDHYGHSYASISRRIGEHKQKIIDIRGGKLQATGAMIDKLKNTYPELRLIQEEDKTDERYTKALEKIVNLHEEISELQKKVFELEQKQSELVKRLETK